MPQLELQSPDGSWERINAKPNALMFHILEEACASFGLKTDNCVLEVKKILIDLSAKVSNARIPINATIDVIDKGRPLVNDLVNLTIQLPNNRRIGMSVESKRDFWDILSCMRNDNPTEPIFPDSDNKVIALCQMQDQIIGEFALKNSSLNSIGIRNGRILLRLIHKECTDNEISNINSMINSRKALLESKLFANQQRRNKTLQTNVIDSKVMERKQPSPSKPCNEFPRFGSPVPGTQMTSPYSAFYEPNRPMEIVNTGNITEENTSVTLGEMFGICLDSEQNNPQRMSQQPNFSNFKFPTANPNQDGSESQPGEDKDVKRPKRSMEEQDSVFFKRIVAERTEFEEIPDSFYELTERDIRKQIEDYRIAAESEQPLMLQSTRQRVREKAFAKYKWCIIQFNFSDSFILQSTFLPSDTVGDLYRHIREYFKCYKVEFNLFTTPPKNILKAKDITLLQADLIPMSKVYVSVEAGALYSGDLKELISEDGVNKSYQIIQKRMVSYNEGSNDNGMDSQTDSITSPENTVSAPVTTSNKPPTSNNAISSRPGASSNTKVPTWFRSTKK